MNFIKATSRTVRNKTIPVILALLLYVLPNMVQDVHRVFGHYHLTVFAYSSSGNNIQQCVDKCPVCHFEFCAVDEIKTDIFAVVVATSNVIFKFTGSHQLSHKVFDYSQLRAPPAS
jgi:hypothetical protein